MINAEISKTGLAKAQVVSNNAQGATLGAEEWAKAMNYKGTFVELFGKPSDNNAQVRSDGYHQVISQYPDLKQDGKEIANWDRQTGQDKMESLLSKNPDVQGVIAGNDEMALGAINALKDKGKLKAGDKIGHVYFEGEYGEGGLAGTKYWASKNGSTVVEQKIQATDEDMTGQVAALKRAGVKAIAVTTGPKQLASIAGIAASQGLNVPIVGNNPTFDPAVMASPAAKALAANAYIAGSISAWTLDKPMVKQVGDEFVAKPGTTLTILLGANGRAKTVSIVPDDVDASPLGACIKAVFKAAKFAPRSDDQEIEVNLT